MYFILLPQQGQFLSKSRLTSAMIINIFRGNPYVSEVPTMPLPLVERSEKEIMQIVKKKIDTIKDVKGYHQLSVHNTGKRAYVEMHVLLDNNLTFEETHRIASNIESEVRSTVPNARVTIHTEPVGSGHQNIWNLIKEIAEKTQGSRGAHNIHIQKIDGKLGVDLHLEVSANMTVKQAHDVSDEVERKIKEASPKITEITIHIESATERILREQTGVETELESYIQHLANSFPEIKSVLRIKIRRVGDVLHIVLSCIFDPNIEIKKAHKVSSRLEQEIKKAYPKITRIDVHEEPADC
jgi:divalent metal cation (Fe/Co/Zn/Cd) transporter